MLYTSTERSWQRDSRAVAISPVRFCRLLGPFISNLFDMKLNSMQTYNELVTVDTPVPEGVSVKMRGPEKFVP